MHGYFQLQVNGKAAVVTTPNPRDNAKYSHWYYKSDHHPADVPSCGKLCSKGENPECEIKDWVTNSGAEFKCTGKAMLQLLHLIRMKLQFFNCFFYTLSDTNHYESLNIKHIT